MDSDDVKRLFADLVSRLGQQVRGKPEAIEQVLICLFARGHVLIEDVPGVGKTRLARALGAALTDADVKRVQGTPDLLPSDIQGVSIYHADKRDFSFARGPIFTNILHCDEINRIPPRTQSALLEAMEEEHVTVRGTPEPLLRPFFVVATQNPVEMSGTYRLPEAQLDRFMMRISLGYPADLQQEVEVLRDFSVEPGRLPAVLAKAHVNLVAEAADSVHVSEPMVEYVARLLRESRERARLGASPRAGLALLRAARVRALSQGRGHVLPDDVTELAIPVLAHRLTPHGQAGVQAQNDLVRGLLATVHAPQNLPTQQRR